MKKKDTLIALPPKNFMKGGILLLSAFDIIVTKSWWKELSFMSMKDNSHLQFHYDFMVKELSFMPMKDNSHLQFHYNFMVTSSKISGFKV